MGKDGCMNCATEHCGGSKSAVPSLSRLGGLARIGARQSNRRGTSGC